MMNSNRITTVDGKKYLLQHPTYNNCLVVSLFNAFLDDNQNLDLEALGREEKRLNTKYDIDNHGLQATMIGDIAWRHGYSSCMNVSPYPVDQVKHKLACGHKLIRVFGWKVGESFMTYNMSEQYNRYHTRMSYDTTVKKKPRKIVTGVTGNGAHAFFVKDLRDDGKFLGINYAIGVNNCYEDSWFGIGLNHDAQKQGYAQGTELCLFVKKRS